MTTLYTEYETAAQNIIDKIGKHIIIGVPLALGKPVGLLNALYRLAEKDSTVNLTIITGLTLSRPLLKNELEKRFVEPFLDRILGDYEDLLYEKARERQQLPRNINVIEFFLSPGKYLHNAYVQRNYISCTYTNAVRDIQALGMNVIAQMVASNDTGHEYSLSCNSDLFYEALDRLQKENKAIAVVAEVNSNLPFMYDDAIVKREVFTHIIDTHHYPTLFSLPHDELLAADHLIGLYTSTLIPDNGCLQIGIGKLSSAVTSALILRQHHNALYQEVLHKLNFKEKFGTPKNTEPFVKGLYASTELLSDDYLDLYRAGILKKQVYDNIELQKLANAGEVINQSGKILHAAFFLGTQDLYKTLRNMPPAERQLFAMTSVSRTNSLTFNYELLSLQRQNMRFVNSAMMVTVDGNIISDGLQNLQEVSGVGGQYDFIEMSPKLPGSRSIINCRSTKHTKSGLKSNIVWDYTNFTIPRYLRDIVITEYGIADCRSKTDEDVIKAMLNIADSRVQDELMSRAKQAGKLAANYKIPLMYKNNFPQVIEKIAEEFKSQGLFKSFPFGTEFTPEELVLKQALLALKTAKTGNILKIFWRGLWCKLNCSLYLKRMKLNQTKNSKEWFYKILIRGAIASNFSLHPVE